MISVESIFFAEQPDWLKYRPLLKHHLQQASEIDTTQEFSPEYNPRIQVNQQSRVSFFLFRVLISPFLSAELMFQILPSADLSSQPNKNQRNRHYLSTRGPFT